MKKALDIRKLREEFDQTFKSSASPPVRTEVEKPFRRGDLQTVCSNILDFIHSITSESKSGQSGQ